MIESIDEREVLGWLEFGDASRELATAVVESGFEPDFVIAIARGGLLLAGAIAYALDTKACGALNVEFYTGVDQRLPEPVLLPPMLDHQAIVGKRVLLVDDVSDSGRTLDLVVTLLEKTGAAVRTVCLYSKPRTVREPDFVWHRTDRWITFPWSAMAPVTAEPAMSEPASSDSAWSGPALSGPALSGPALSEPALSEAAVAEQ